MEAIPTISLPGRIASGPAEESGTGSTAGLFAEMLARQSLTGYSGAPPARGEEMNGREEADPRPPDNEAKKEDLPEVTATADDLLSVISASLPSPSGVFPEALPGFSPTGADVSEGLAALVVGQVSPEGLSGQIGTGISETTVPVQDLTPRGANRFFAIPETVSAQFTPVSGSPEPGTGDPYTVLPGLTPTSQGNSFLTGSSGGDTAQEGILGPKDLQGTIGSRTSGDLAGSLPNLTASAEGAGGPFSDFDQAPIIRETPSISLAVGPQPLRAALQPEPQNSAFNNNRGASGLNRSLGTNRHRDFRNDRSGSRPNSARVHPVLRHPGNRIGAGYPGQRIP